MVTAVYFLLGQLLFRYLLLGICHLSRYNENACLSLRYVGVCPVHSHIILISTLQLLLN